LHRTAGTSNACEIFLIVIVCYFLYSCAFLLTRDADYKKRNWITTRDLCVAWFDWDDFLTSKHLPGNKTGQWEIGYYRPLIVLFHK